LKGRVERNKGPRTRSFANLPPCGMALRRSSATFSFQVGSRQSRTVQVSSHSVGALPGTSPITRHQGSDLPPESMFTSLLAPIRCTVGFAYGRNFTLMLDLVSRLSSVNLRMASAQQSGLANSVKLMLAFPIETSFFWVSTTSTATKKSGLFFTSTMKAAPHSGRVLAFATSVVKTPCSFEVNLAWVFPDFSSSALSTTKR